MNDHTKISASHLSRRLRLSSTVHHGSSRAQSRVDATPICLGEHQTKNGAHTRNARLAAIRSLFRYAALRHPDHACLIERVLAIPPKRFDRKLVTVLTEPEISALLAAIDRSTWTGRRDHSLFSFAAQTGLRASGST
jgi:integrase